MGVGYPPLDVHSQVRTGRCRFFVEVLTILCRDTVAVTIHPQHGEPFGATLVSNDAGISGWRAGPHGMHQERYFNTSGEPTGLVRNDGFESLADLPQIKVPPKSLWRSHPKIQPMVLPTHRYPPEAPPPTEPIQGSLLPQRTGFTR